MSGLVCRQAHLLCRALADRWRRSEMTTPKGRPNVVIHAPLALFCFGISCCIVTAEEKSLQDKISHPGQEDINLRDYTCFNQKNETFAARFHSSLGVPFGIVLAPASRISAYIWLAYMKLFFAGFIMVATIGFSIYMLRSYFYFTRLKKMKLKTLRELVLKHGSHVDQVSWRWKKPDTDAEINEIEKKRAHDFKAKEKALKMQRKEFWKAMDVQTKINDGATFSNYVVKRKIAEGGFGKVYEVQDVNGNLYAMKVEPLTTLVYGIKQDLEVLYALKDSGGDVRFCKVFDTGVKHDLKYMVMTILGPPLQNFFIRHKKEHFPLGCVMDLAKQTLESIEALHNAGYVHRDLKVLDGIILFLLTRLLQAENWVLGNINADIHEQRKVYLIDFGSVYKFSCSSCERKKERASKAQSSTTGDPQPIVITYDQYFEKYFNEKGKRIPEKMGDELIKVSEATYQDFRLFFDDNLVRIPSIYVREVVRTFLKERKIDEQYKKLDAMLTPNQRDYVKSTLPSVSSRFNPREVLRDPHRSNFKKKLMMFFTPEGQILPKLLKVRPEELESTLNTFRTYFDVHDKLDKCRLYQEVDLTAAMKLCDANDAVRTRVNRCEKILKRHRCNHFKIQHGGDAFPYVKPSKHELNASPYTMYYCALVKHFLKPYGRKDDLESWFYSLVDWTTTIPWRLIDDDVGIVKMKLSSRWDLAKKEFIGRCPEEFEELLVYIDSLNFNERPNYSYIYDLLEKVIRVNKLKYLPLTTMDHQQALKKPSVNSATISDKPKPRVVGRTGR
uniref:Protein kinase domain-containing protein n=1 Tax=Steinernema glaseri TaxID=37863 RepID=A0A1I7YV86_9BILA